ncbi:UNVERIFIED_CONTAM: hypothetical protein QO022_41075, partial [Pseudomonas aeruginosa]
GGRHSASCALAINERSRRLRRGLRVVVALRNCQIWQARKKENLARKKISVFFQGEIGRAIWRFWYFSTGSRLGVSPRINVTFCAAPFRVCTIGIALAG